MKKNKTNTSGKLTKEDLNKLTKEELEWLDNEHIKALEGIKNFTEQIKELHKENVKISSKLGLNDTLKCALEKINSLPLCLAMDKYYDIFWENRYNPCGYEISALFELSMKAATALNDESAIGKHELYLNFIPELYSLLFSIKGSELTDYIFNELIRSLREYREILSSEDFSILIADYCNNFIFIGLHNYIDIEENFGLNEFFSTCDEKDIIYCIYTGIYTQDYTWFEAVYKENKNNIIANLYLFTKNLTELMYYYVKKQKQPAGLEEDTWGHYNRLSKGWKEFAVQQMDRNTTLSESRNEENHAMFPFVSCASGKDITVNTICENLEQIVQKFDIKEEGDIFYNICEEICYKCGLGTIISKNKPILQLLKGKEHKKNYRKILPNIAEIFNCLQVLWLHVIRKPDMKDEMPFINYPRPDKNSDYLDKVKFLHLINPLHDTINKTYIIGRYDNYMRKKEIDRLNQEKIDMMEHYTHNWKHICYPGLVKDVAEMLLKKEDDESITMANKLFKAYNSEQILNHEIQLLQYTISNNSKEVRYKFEDGFSDIDEEEDSDITVIKNILTNSLDMVVFRILMEDADDSNRIRRCRARIKNIEALRESYTESFIRSSDTDLDIWGWLEENKMIDITADISEEWNEVKILRSSFAEAQLSSIIVEILTNIFLHGCDKAEISLSQTDISMDITAKNLCNAESEGNIGSGKGLSSMKKVVEKINMGSNIKESISSNKNGNEFTVCVRFDKDIVYND